MKSTFARGLTQTTPFPNILIDEVMPRLKDTEWRLLCVIVRQTLGWHDEITGYRKERDWLTRSQLKTRTGRNSEAISLAIDTLVKQRYITAQNNAGMLLKTPSERRNNHGRIYYGISDYWKNQIMSNRKSEQLPVLAGTIFQTSDPESKHNIGRKPNTTKETQTKESTEQVMSYEQSSFIESFKAYAQKYNIKKPDIRLYPDTRERLNHWLQTTTEKDQMLALQKYFCSDLFFIVQREYSLRTFVNTCNILQIIQKPHSTTASSGKSSFAHPNSL